MEGEKTFISIIQVKKVRKYEQQLEKVFQQLGMGNIKDIVIWDYIQRRVYWDFGCCLFVIWHKFCLFLVLKAALQ